MGRIRVSVWRNVTTEGKVWHSFTFTRAYKNAQGQWSNASSFGVDDLLVLAELARLARIWVEDESQRERQAQKGRQPGDDTGTENQDVGVDPSNY
jgi:hypothetical protein